MTAPLPANLDREIATPSMSAEVAAEVRRYGSLDRAIAGLSNDACGAPWGSAVRAILSDALAYREALLRAA